jgi:hypothetical protein
MYDGTYPHCPDCGEALTPQEIRAGATHCGRHAQAEASYQDTCEMCGTTTGERICAGCLRELSAVANLDDSARN